MRKKSSLKKCSVSITENLKEQSVSWIMDWIMACYTLISADAVGGITKYYKLAFGSFVDKTVAPFIQPAQL